MPGNSQDWRKAMNEALKRTGKRLFESGYNAMSVYMVLEPSRAWCCAPYTPLGSRGAQGPQKTKAHLRTMNHFREWCLEHPKEAVEKFPETKVIFAEIELTRVEKPARSSSSMPQTINTAQNLPPGHGIP